MPRKWTKKQERMYKHILATCQKKQPGKRKRGKKTCQRIAAATVNKYRRYTGARRWARAHGRKPRHVRPQTRPFGACDCEK